MTLNGCDFSQWPNECWSPTLYVDDYDMYMKCYEMAGCDDTAGSSARRPFFDLMAFRRKQ